MLQYYFHRFKAEKTGEVLEGDGNKGYRDRDWKRGLYEEREGKFLSCSIDQTPVGGCLKKEEGKRIILHPLHRFSCLVRLVSYYSVDYLKWSFDL